MRRLLLIAGCALLVAGCETPAIQVTPQPNVAAVKIQNQETKKQVTKTRSHIKKIRQHIDTSQQETVKEADKLQSVKKDLEELLKEK